MNVTSSSFLETRGSGIWRSDCLRMLQRYGSAAHLPALEVYAGRPGLSAKQRQEIEALIGRLRDR